MEKEKEDERENEEEGIPQEEGTEKGTVSKKEFIRAISVLCFATDNFADRTCPPSESELPQRIANTDAKEIGIDNNINVSDLADEGSEKTKGGGKWNIIKKGKKR